MGRSRPQCRLVKPCCVEVNIVWQFLGYGPALSVAVAPKRDSDRSAPFAEELRAQRELAGLSREDLAAGPGSVQPGP